MKTTRKSVSIHDFWLLSCVLYPVFHLQFYCRISLLTCISLDTFIFKSLGNAVKRIGISNSNVSWNWNSYLSRFPCILLHVLLNQKDFGETGCRTLLFFLFLFSNFFSVSCVGDYNTRNGKTSLTPTRISFLSFFLSFFLLFNKSCTNTNAFLVVVRFSFLSGIHPLFFSERSVPSSTSMRTETEQQPNHWTRKSETERIERIKSSHKKEKKTVQQTVRRRRLVFSVVIHGERTCHYLLTSCVHVMILFLCQVRTERKTARDPYTVYL